VLRVLIMRAVAVRKLGDVPELMDLPKPAPGPGEILVRMRAAGVNPFDWKISDGTAMASDAHVFPLILGVDGAGTVEAVGEGVTRFSINDGVYGQFLHSPVGIGTYAEYSVAPETLGISLSPRGMYDDQAAAVPTPGMTALTAIDKLGLTKGQTLLILGASGGVGSFAVQLASNAGVTVLTSSRGPHGDYLRKLGASRFYDASSPNLVEDIRRAYSDGLDALLDLAQRGPAFEHTLGVLRPNGIAASTIGAATEAVVAPLGFRPMNVNLQPQRELLDRLAKEFTTGRLRIPLDEKLPLAAAPDAIARSRAGTGRGKTVLTI
jgi:NADPH:quinone reductase-like Zn-dependent oxidoreductase